MSRDQRPEAPGDVLQHELWRLAGHVPPRDPFPEAFHARIADHADDHRIGTGTRRLAVREGLDEGDAERVDAARHELHDCAPLRRRPARESSPKYRLMNTFSRIAI